MRRPADRANREMSGDPVPPGLRRGFFTHRAIVAEPFGVMTDVIPKGLDPTRIQQVIESLKALGEQIAAKPVVIQSPDPDDQMFIEVAVAGVADAIVSGNAKHFRSSPEPGMPESVLPASPRCRSVEHPVDHGTAGPHLLGQLALGEAGSLHRLAESKGECFLEGEKLGFFPDLHLIEEGVQTRANVLVAHHSVATKSRISDCTVVPP